MLNFKTSRNVVLAELDAVAELVSGFMFILSTVKILRIDKTPSRNVATDENEPERLRETGMSAIFAFLGIDDVIADAVADGAWGVSGT